ncbi:hypothetical protein EOS_26105 [Caballeronia mineralivorans PML1(12)]|uniref:Uncharacterized protein n=1 Tax=Caballeronia mineralivorans PML1(12) TaxID=908627 RepID=A0A0J1CRP1_9BURK|nr:hypothetical protein EOS_26105 [Caballeronia mineralivorans PML1(12)]
MIQCRFSLSDSDEDSSGTASAPESTASLLRCLKKIIADAHFVESKALTLFLENGMIARLLPEKDGLESYVLHTGQGIVPVIDF